MRDTDEQRALAEEERARVTRRKFLEHSATVGSAALLTATTAASEACAQGARKPATDKREDSAAQNLSLQGEMTEYKSGDMMIPAYVSRSTKREAPRGAVFVIHEVFGLNDHIKGIADRIAREGYLALAPNLFVRASAPPPKDASDVAALRRAVSSIPNEVAIKDMQAGLDFLKTFPEQNKNNPRFVSIGFCMGGGFSYQLATHTKDLAGAVIFYGRTPLELVSQVSCPLLGNFAELDGGIPPAAVKEFEVALKRSGKTADIKIYAGAKHGFFNDTRPEAYNAEAATDAWQRTLKFFDERINKKP